ncbi:hypothetical protein [Dyadobacter sandarakinus]|uniref:Uncharacterized protein n=1 Tax=Dyadobacter sandarakinus TaxID=2747268 RepID=A0ABX7I1Q2_9BACT|nr:hypothetical protein [Dyadobacter sandarakinus]QRQ99728.1 hypothetical protein HWI92_01750 [Dyadobacter sandarakinus]
MEDKKERLIELADKKPRLALIYGMAIIIGVLCGVIIYQDNRVSNADSLKDAALKEQSALIKGEYNERIKSLEQGNRDKDQKIEEYQKLVVARTDVFADKMTQFIQDQLDKKEKIDAQRAKIDKNRKTYRAVTEEKIKQLQTQSPNE